MKTKTAIATVLGIHLACPVYANPIVGGVRYVALISIVTLALGLEIATMMYLLRGKGYRLMPMLGLLCVLNYTTFNAFIVNEAIPHHRSWLIDMGRTEAAITLFETAVVSAASHIRWFRSPKSAPIALAYVAFSCTLGNVVSIVAGLIGGSLWTFFR